jgi:hypothetical protein
MPQTYVDDEAYEILKGIQGQMKESGIKGATLGDAIRRLKLAYDRARLKQGDFEATTKK